MFFDGLLATNSKNLLAVDISEDFNFEQFKVGRSNITFKIFDDPNTFVLRSLHLDSN